MGWPITPKLLFRMMAYCSRGGTLNWRRLIRSPSRLRRWPSEGACRRSMSARVHSRGTVRRDLSETGCPASVAPGRAVTAGTVPKEAVPASALPPRAFPEESSSPLPAGSSLPLAAAGPPPPVSGETLRRGCSLLCSAALCSALLCCSLLSCSMLWVPKCAFPSFSVENVTFSV